MENDIDTIWSFAPSSELVQTMGKVCDQLDILRGANREGGIYDKEWADIMTKWRNLAQVVWDGVQFAADKTEAAVSVVRDNLSESLNT